MNRFEFYDNVRKFKENQEENSLTHYGTKGQKWGERHWQNADGTFNEAGKERYFGSSNKKGKKESDAKDLSKQKIGYYSTPQSAAQNAITEMRVKERITNETMNSYSNADKSHLSRIMERDYFDRINRMQNALAKGKTEKYNKLLNKFKEEDREIVADYVKKLNDNIKENEDAYKYDYIHNREKFDLETGKTSNESTSLEGTNPTRKTENAMNDILERAKLGSLSKPKINPKYLNEDGSINDLGKKKLETRSKVADISSSVFKVLKYLNLGSLAIAGPATFALSLTGFGLPIALINTLLVAGTSGGAAAIDSTLSKKLSSRADVYYDKLVEYEKKNK